MFKKPGLLIFVGLLAAWGFGFIKTGITAVNLKPFIKDLKFKFQDIYTSILSIDLELFNGENTAVKLNVISADVFYNNNLIGAIVYNANQTIAAQSSSIISGIEVKINNLSAAPSLLPEIKNILTGQPTTANIKLDGKITANGKQFPLQYATSFKFNQNKPQKQANTATTEKLSGFKKSPIL